MNSQVENLSSIENMGSAERGARSVLGLGMIVAVLVTPAFSETAVAGLSMSSIYIMFTAITGWDPFYALMRKPQRQLPPAPPTATIRPRNMASHSTDELKKAA